MATANITEIRTVSPGTDSVVIRSCLGSIIGGRTLDVADYPLEVIQAGHVIIRDTVTGDYKPMPLAEGNQAYDSLPASHVYVGVAVASVTTKRPFVGIMYNGEVNDVASPFPIDSIKSAFLAACPHITFMHD